MKIAIAGINTDVGKTIVSAILAEKLHADYWKPIQAGSLESLTLKSLSRSNIVCHPEAYSFSAHLSPHYAAKLENLEIHPQKILPPQTSQPLIIELAGGVMSPLNDTYTQLDWYAGWDCRWIIVSRHYLGSINHTLLTYESLKLRNVDIAGIIFNGNDTASSEAFILNYTQLPCLGKLSQEPNLDYPTIQRYAAQWQFQL